MSWATALVSGFGLGLLYFGAVWRTARRVASEPRAPRSVGDLVARPARMGLAAVAFYGCLKTAGVPAVLAGLTGVMLARGYLIRLVARTANGR
jgi:hypothetical protein